MCPEGGHKIKKHERQKISDIAFLSGVEQNKQKKKEEQNEGEETFSAKRRNGATPKRPASGKVPNNPCR